MMMNRINQAFQNKKDILSIYFTAGFPELDDTLIIIRELDKAKVDICLLYTSPSPRDRTRSRMPSSA